MLAASLNNVFIIELGKSVSNILSLRTHFQVVHGILLLVCVIREFVLKGFNITLDTTGSYCAG